MRKYVTEPQANRVQIRLLTAVKGGRVEHPELDPEDGEVAGVEEAKYSGGELGEAWLGGLEQQNHHKHECSRCQSHADAAAAIPGISGEMFVGPNQGSLERSDECAGRMHADAAAHSLEFQGISLRPQK